MQMVFLCSIWEWPQIFAKQNLSLPTPSVSQGDFSVSRGVGILTVNLVPYEVLLFLFNNFPMVVFISNPVYFSLFESCPSLALVHFQASPVLLMHKVANNWNSLTLLLQVPWKGEYTLPTWLWLWLAVNSKWVKGMQNRRYLPQATGTSSDRAHQTVGR